MVSVSIHAVDCRGSADGQWAFTEPKYSTCQLRGRKSAACALLIRLHWPQQRGRRICTVSVNLIIMKKKTSLCGRFQTFHSHLEWQQGGIRRGGVHISPLTNQLSFWDCIFFLPKFYQLIRLFLEQQFSDAVNLLCFGPEFYKQQVVLQWKNGNFVLNCFIFFFFQGFDWRS